ncbi:hypothetical protein CAEBREN_12571 [Caenorhabditis brenneri]|uniref:Uncharacterized protein n=1 Tax=Caenorhabditis brenneri TaxID=135651 RepID=G0P339_CAEBE|nr:hypothetical protein CAEBREN_12571 [Caenorhabditis brenneri]
METISLKIMYSDLIATIEDGVDEKITLKDESNVSNQVYNYLSKRFLNEQDVWLEEISILLLSYHNPPQLPPNLPCTNWAIKCESYTPYVLDLLNSIPPNCEKLEIEIDNWSFKEIADTEQVRTAEELSLKTSDPRMEMGLSEEQIQTFEAVKLYLNEEKLR